MASRNKERPNLKICIDNSEDAGNSEESEEENNEEESSSENSGSENEIDLDVSEQEEEEMEAAITLGDNRGDESPYRDEKFNKQRTRDSDDEEEEKVRRRREESAKRFGVKVPSAVASDVDLTKLYDSLGIKKKELEDGYNYRGVRLEAIHIRGVDNLKTRDVLEYFKDFSPKTVEWIDDCSCNVVWDGVGNAIRAINTLSQDPEDGIEEEDSEDEDSKAAATKAAKEEDEDELNLMSDEEDMEEGEIKEAPKAKGEKKKKYVITPPGRWRVGKKFRSKRLFLRFAMKADKKYRGAEQRKKKFKVYGDESFEGPPRIPHQAKPDKGEVFREDVPVDPSRPTQVFEAIPDDYDLEETFGVVSSKPKKTTKPIPSYMVDYNSDIVGPTYEETLAMYSQAAKDRLTAQEKLGLPAVPEPPRPKRRHSGSESESSDIDYEEELETLLRQPLNKKRMRMYADDIEDETSTLRSGATQSSVLDARSRIEYRKLERKMHQDEGSDLRSKLRRESPVNPPSKFHNLHNLKVQIDAE